MLVATLFAWTLLQHIDITLALPSPSRRLGSREQSITVPSCAASCVQTLIQQSFPTCANQQDLDCLCTNRSLTGYTIGEDILQCVISDCAGATSDQLSQAYSICNSIPNAVQPTHATITANIATETTIFAEPSSAPTSSAAAASTPTTLIATTSAVTSSSSSSSSTAQATPATSTSSTTAPVATPSINPGVPKSAIIGVSVGLGALALIAMALLSFVCCCRCRDRRESAHSYETTKQPLISDKETSNAPTPVRPSRTNPYMPSKAQSFLGQKYPGWSPISDSNRSTSPYQPLTATPSDMRSITPHSAATYQTTSQLLPEKPLLKSPTRPVRDGTEGTPLTMPLMAQTRVSSSGLGTSPDSVDSGRILHKKPSDPFLQVPASHYSLARVTGDNQKTARMNLPKLNTKTVQFANPISSASATQQQQQHQPVAPYDPTSYVRLAETQKRNWRTTVPVQTRNTNIDHAASALTTETTVPVKSWSTPGVQRSTSRSQGTTFNKYRPILPSRSRRAASTITSFEMESDNDSIVPVPPLVILKKPVPAPTVQSNGQQTRPHYSSPTQKQQPSSATTATPISRIQYPAVPTITMTPVSSTDKTQNLPSASQRKSVRFDQPYTTDTSLMDNSPLLGYGSAQSDSNQEWVPVKLVATPSFQTSNFNRHTIYRKPLIHQTSLPTQSQPLISTPSNQQSAPTTIPEYSSSDTPQPSESTTQTGEQSTSRSPKAESRGARLGAAIASNTPQARPRGNSESNVRILIPSAPTRGHVRSQSHAVDAKPQALKMYRPLDEIGLEPAARRQIQHRSGKLY